MLLQLSVENLALIECISLNPDAGLSVLTGETGAGKSVLVDAMDILTGGRAFGEQVRTGSDKAVVDGLFDYSQAPHVYQRLIELGLPVSEDSSLLLSREILPGGRSTCRVNGRAVPLAMYRSLGELLVDLHGQHEHQSLLKIHKHRELLDRFSGLETSQQRFLVSELYNRLCALNQECASVHANETTVANRIDYLRHALAEIALLKPSPGEDSVLRQESERLRHAEKLAELAKEAAVSLSEGAGRQLAADDLVSQAAAKIMEMARYDASAGDMSAVLAEAQYRLEDVSNALRRYREQLEFDPGRAQEVEERLHALRNMSRKYGPSLEEVISFQSRASAELEDLERQQSRLKEFEAAHRNVRQEYDRAARTLSALRREKAVAFIAVVTRELHGLGMEKARLDIRWEGVPEPTRWGYDQLEFLFSANPGEPLKPLSKIASGGEMSRVMLALKVIFAENDEIPTLIFDEIDTGIGGRTLQIVGDRLATLARFKQVLCVTHSPHIAGRGDRHFYIEKVVNGDQTRTVVNSLDYQSRVLELTRMLGGTEQEEITRIHAEQILKQS